MPLDEGRNPTALSAGRFAADAGDEQPKKVFRYAFLSLRSAGCEDNFIFESTLANRYREGNR
jgi:hypothetical protein